MKTRLTSMAFAALLLLWGVVSSAGEFEDGQAAYKRGYYKTALAKFTKAANKGDVKAQHMLGEMHYEGRGVLQDYKQAMSWYRKAAGQGYANAQTNLGAMYFYGEGVPQDYKQAMSWWRKAADQGDAEAQNNLGEMYKDGQGVTQDYIEAYKWFNIAAAYGNDKTVRSLASARRNNVAKQMTPAQIAEAQKRAEKWKKK